MKSASFFDRYPDEYDLLTDEKSRIPRHQSEVDALISKFSPGRVLDAGCGTGLTTSLFARRGIETVGIDRSSPMLEVARRKYHSKKWPLQFKKSAFESLPVSFKGSFDLITCLGNSLSGVESATTLRATARSFARSLRPGGVLVLQLLNVASLADGELYPVRATRAGKLFYLRYLIRSGKSVALHVVRIDSSTKAPSFQTFVHEHKPLDQTTLQGALRSAGFRDIKLCGDLFLKETFTRTNRDLVLVAKRPK
jgi:ubiquinone/menaquinone biosynthesis C-methylase UbiE